MRIPAVLIQVVVAVVIVVTAGIMGGVSGYNFGLTKPKGGYRSEGWFSSPEFDREVNSVLYGILGAVGGALAAGFVIGLIILVLALMRRSQNK